MGPRHDLSFCACTTACLASELLVAMGPNLHPWFLHSNSDFWNRSTSLYGSQTSPAVLCMQNSDFRTTITSLCGSKVPTMVLACKTASSGREQQVSMGPRHDLLFYACTTACLASELLVPMGPSPHFRFLQAKQRLLDQNYKSLWVPELTCRFVLAKQCA